jgi:hypothetical protein
MLPETHLSVSYTDNGKRMSIGGVVVYLEEELPRWVSRLFPDVNKRVCILYKWDMVLEEFFPIYYSSIIFKPRTLPPND